MVDDALRVARGPRRVAERDCLPFVAGELPGELRVATRDERLVIGFAQPLASGPQRVGHVDNEWLVPHARERSGDQRREFGVGDKHLRFAVLEHEAERLGVEPRVQRVQHAARHRNAEMAFDHFGCVGEHRGNGVAAADP